MRINGQVIFCLILRFALYAIGFNAQYFSLCQVFEAKCAQRKIIIAAEYDIQFGEEITYDYKLPLESADKKIPCLCGAFICKGTMN